MSQNDISKYFTKQNGSAITNDTEFAGLATHTVIKNTNSGLTFKKVGATVFDKEPIEIETDAVLYTAQTLTNSQKQQARENIGVDELDGVPLGTIVMWSGKAASIPDGWQICDGNNGTPNLVGRFVIGRSSAYPLNTYGGSTDHFHYFGWHNGDNYGRFYLNGDIHGSDFKNTAKSVKAPSKAAIISSLEYNDSAPNYKADEIKAKSAMWNGDNGGGISDQNFHRGNMITSLGYGVSADDTLKNCLPPYWSLYYIMKVRGTGSTSNGGTAASASQVERLSDLISQLQARITTLESSSSSGSSGSGGSGFTFGNVETKTIVLQMAQGSNLIGTKIPAGTILYGSTGYNFNNETVNYNAIELKAGSYIVVKASTITNSINQAGSTNQGTYIVETHSVKVRKITGVNV